MTNSLFVKLSNQVILSKLHFLSFIQVHMKITRNLFIQLSDQSFWISSIDL